MLNELIEKIAVETGLPVTTVAPVVGALLLHLGDVLPAPIAHHVAVALGVHQEGMRPTSLAPPTSRRPLPRRQDLPEAFLIAAVPLREVSLVRLPWETSQHR